MASLPLLSLLAVHFGPVDEITTWELMTLKAPEPL